MNIIEVFNKFQTQEQAIEYLEEKRWHGKPICPYCLSEKVCRHSSADRENRRLQCQSCSKAFSVTVGTIFHKTHVPLRNWFLVLALMLNAKKSASACQIARDIGMRRPTVWSMMHRIRVAMAMDQENSDLLHGIVEADETYVGGKPRKSNKKEDDKPGPRGRGTKKAAVIGMVERGGRVVAEPAKNLTNKYINKFIEKYLDKNASILVTDEFRGYQPVGKYMKHLVINHSERFVDGFIHTNTIESVWSLLKRAYIGQHHHYSEKYLPLYVAETAYKYNRRRVESIPNFDSSVSLMVAL